MPECVHRRLDSQSNSSSIVTEDVGQRDEKPLNSNNNNNNKKRKRGHDTAFPVRTDGKVSNGHYAPRAPSRNGDSNGKEHPEYNEQKTTFGQKKTSHSESQSKLKDTARALWSKRKALPIWSHASEIRQGLNENDVMLLVGETGSGKSTQVPQILVEEVWCKPRSTTFTTIDQAIDDRQDSNKGSELAGGRRSQVGGCIAITEPRRVAAITLARRVAEEMATPLGSSSPASKVGYSVRFDNSTSPSTKIKFLTEGMLLQEMLRDPWLTAYSAVIVDEVHERGVNVDLVLGFLRRMIDSKYEGRGGIPLKLIVMSATAEMERLKDFFEAAYNTPDTNGNRSSHENIAGKHPDSDSESEWSGISSSSSDNDYTMRKNVINTKSHNGSLPPQAPDGKHERHSSATKKGATPPSAANGKDERSSSAMKKGATPPTAALPVGQTPHIATCHIEGRQYPVTINYTPEPVQDWVDAALRTIFQIHYKEPLPGDILVFLTGQETIESLESLINEYAPSMSPDVPKMLVLPLFAALPQAAQQRVFQPAPYKTRKIILATNIAETSVTVSGVRFVIDCGKAKTKQFRTAIGLDSLLVKSISKSAAIQRKGRAGREASGQCYRLYTEQAYLDLQVSNAPEILRSDLSQSILTMKARGVNDIINFPFLDPPPREALERALLKIYQLGALSDSGAISEVGLQMAKLPLTVSLGRVLVAAAEPEYDCVAEVIDVISCLSVENVFLNLKSEDKKEAAEVARRELFCREGDHLTLLKTVQAYAGENSDRKAWAEKHFVSHRAMQAVMSVRKQLMAQNRHPKRGPYHKTSSELSVSIVRCFLKGFATNTARLLPDGSYKTMVGNQTVAIHPSSGLFGKKLEAIMFNEFVFTNRSYAKGVSAVQPDWIAEAMGV